MNETPTLRVLHACSDFAPVTLRPVPPAPPSDDRATLRPTSPIQRVTQAALRNAREIASGTVVVTDGDVRFEPTAMADFLSDNIEDAYVIGETIGLRRGESAELGVHCGIVTVARVS